MKIVHWITTIAIVISAYGLAHSQDDGDVPAVEEGPESEVPADEAEPYTRNYNALFVVAYELDGEWLETETNTYVATGDGPHAVIVYFNEALEGDVETFSVDRGTTAQSFEHVDADSTGEVLPAVRVSWGMDVVPDDDADLAAEPGGPPPAQIDLDDVIIWETKGHCWKEGRSKGVCKKREPKACRIYVRYEDADEVYQGDCDNKFDYKAEDGVLKTNLTLLGG